MGEPRITEPLLRSETATRNIWHWVKLRNTRSEHEASFRWKELRLRFISHGFSPNAKCSAVQSLRAARKGALFEFGEDPAGERTAAGRYTEPSLFGR
jgi:hypothetical protein